LKRPSIVIEHHLITGIRAFRRQSPSTPLLPPGDFSLCPSFYLRLHFFFFCELFFSRLVSAHLCDNQELRNIPEIPGFFPLPPYSTVESAKKVFPSNISAMFFSRFIQLRSSPPIFCLPSPWRSTPLNSKKHCQHLSGSPEAPPPFISHFLSLSARVFSWPRPLWFQRISYRKLSPTGDLFFMWTPPVPPFSPSVFFSPSSVPYPSELSFPPHP